MSQRKSSVWGYFEVMSEQMLRKRFIFWFLKKHLKQSLKALKFLRATVPYFDSNAFENSWNAIQFFSFTDFFLKTTETFLISFMIAPEMEQKDEILQSI